MKLTYRPYRLEFRHPFGLSSHSRKETPVVFVRLEQDGVSGYGEACLPAYLGETVETTVAFLESARVILENMNSSAGYPSESIASVHGISEGTPAAKAAIDMALHDLWGKLNGRPCCELLGLECAESRATSFTIAIDAEDKLEQKIHEASDYAILKIKAGTRNDKALIRLVRKFTRKPLYVDVNQGWKDKHFVLDMILWMREQNVVLLEQPMPRSMKEEMQWVTDKSGIPVIADESVRNMDDLLHLDGSFSGINIKLMKCGGLAEAVKMIGWAKKRGIKVMLGCMAESSCGTSAMAQLVQQGDFIDLDAPQLYKNDPFEGIRYRHGRLYVPQEPGIGARPVNGLFG
jgi:L-Ala-D/L-Glu epimerase